MLPFLPLHPLMAMNIKKPSPEPKIGKPVYLAANQHIVSFMRIKSRPAINDLVIFKVEQKNYWGKIVSIEHDQQLTLTNGKIASVEKYKIEGPRDTFTEHLTIAVYALEEHTPFK